MTIFEAFAEGFDEITIFEAFAERFDEIENIRLSGGKSLLRRILYFTVQTIFHDTNYISRYQR